MQITGTRTKARIADAWLSEATRIGSDKVTVQKITEICGISRQTFYKYFQDIIDVMRWSFEREINNIYSEFAATEDPNSAMELFIRRVIGNYNILSKALDSRFHLQAMEIVKLAFRRVINDEIMNCGTERQSLYFHIVTGNSESEVILMENVITAIFSVENEAYRAFSEIKHDMLNESCIIAQLELVKKKDGSIIPCDAALSGVNIGDDTAAGGLLGMFVGILGGPLGVLLGGAAGTVIGMTSDSADLVRDASLVEQVSTKLLEGDTALIALAQETDENTFNAKLSGYQVTIIRRDAAVVAAEVESARELQEELAREARLKMREAKKEEIKQAVDKKKAEVKACFAELKGKITEKGENLHSTVNSKAAEIKGEVTESISGKEKELHAKAEEIRDKVADSIAEAGKGLQEKVEEIKDKVLGKTNS